MIRIVTDRRGLVRNAGIIARQCQNSQPTQTPSAWRLLSQKSPIGASARANSGNSSSTPPPPSNIGAAAPSSIKHAKTSAGTGDPEGLGGTGTGFSTRGPVTWPALGLVAIAAASAVAYYKIERERRLENAMGKVVSSESGWSPNPELLARRKYVRTKWGWFPKEDAFGGGEFTKLSLIETNLSWSLASAVSVQRIVIFQYTTGRACLF